MMGHASMTCVKDLLESCMILHSCLGSQLSPVIFQHCVCTFPGPPLLGNRRLNNIKVGSELCSRKLQGIAHLACRCQNNLAVISQLASHKLQGSETRIMFAASQCCGAGHFFFVGRNEGLWGSA